MSESDELANLRQEKAKLEKICEANPDNKYAASELEKCEATIEKLVTRPRQRRQKRNNKQSFLSY